ncbi:V4R domain-containing protein [Paenibacillus sophorae]|nr:V4R domain-containing protein [Paenibacillus sophorae]
MVCDLEGSIMEGALGKIFSKKAHAREVKCNVNGDEFCEYEIRL